MEDTTQSQVPPGWYDDGSGLQRWWDGSDWTLHVEPSAQASSAEPTPVSTSITPEQRRQLVSMLVANAVSSGWRVEHRDDDSAIVVHGRRPNHVLHLLLTIITVGLWGTVWILLTLNAQETRKTVRVDGQGTVFWQ